MGEIAQAVSNKLGVDIIDRGTTANAYDFAIDTSLFEQTFDFTFTETPATIVDSLIEHYEQAHPQWRDKYIIYNWERNDYGRR